MKLNNQQELIVKLHEGKFCISAAAGSGKTTTLVQHVEHLVRNCGEFENDIMVISFTRAAVDNLKKKLNSLGLYNVHVHTFHSLSAKILSDAGVNISKTIPLWKIDNCFRKINPKPDTENILSYIGFQKNRGRMFNDEFIYSDSAYSEEELRVFFRMYEEEKSKEHSYDFEDWIILALEQLKRNPRKYKFVIADEVQDSNTLNTEILKCISSENLMVIGDARQSIYGFRGSDPTFFLNFDKEFPGAKVLTLDTNYRSNRNIVDNANRFIKPYFSNYEHYSDSITHNQKDGIIEVICNSNAAEEAYKVANMIETMINNGTDSNDISILYRLNSCAEYIEAELRKRKIPYDIANDSSFFKRKEIHGILSYLKLVDNIHDDGAFVDAFNLRNQPLKFMPASVLDDLRIKSGKTDKSMYETFIDFNYPKVWLNKSASEFHSNITRLIMQRDKGVPVEELITNVVKIFDIHGYIKEKYPNQEESKERIAAIEVLKSFVRGNNLKSFLDFAMNSNISKKTHDGVKLMTIHRSKGLEFDTVFVIGVQDSKFPHERSSIEEESRLFYVATTRPKENLYLSQIGTGNRFIEEYMS